METNPEFRRTGRTTRMLNRLLDSIDQIPLTHRRSYVVIVLCAAAKGIDDHAWHKLQKLAETRGADIEVYPKPKYLSITWENGKSARVYWGKSPADFSGLGQDKTFEDHSCFREL